MANSVELRVPFLDNAMIDCACSLPPNYKMYGLKEKFILRKAFEETVPPHVRKRMKFGYNAPLVTFWQADDPLREEAMSQTALRRTGLFDPATVHHRLAEAAATSDIRRKSDLYQTLTGVLSVQLLDQVFLQEGPL
jgi:asparagine synthase (glutamine-hydrolysing)